MPLQHMPFYTLPAEYDHVFGDLVCGTMRQRDPMTLAAFTKTYEGYIFQLPGPAPLQAAAAQAAATFDRLNFLLRSRPLA